MIKLCSIIAVLIFVISEVMIVHGFKVHTAQSIIVSIAIILTDILIGLFALLHHYDFNSNKGVNDNESEASDK